MTIDFHQLHQNWADTEGYAAIWSRSGGNEFYRWPEQADAMKAAAESIGTRESVYYGWSLFETPSRLASVAKVVPGILFDVDIAGVGHAASNYPATEQEALELIRASGLPEPTRIVRSGGGLYLHYLFSAPFVVANEKDRSRVAVLLRGAYQVLAQSFNAAGRKLDNVSDLARVTRPVGAINHKYGTDVRVSASNDDGPRWTVEVWEDLVGNAAKAADPMSYKVRPAEDEQGKGSFELVEQHCAFVHRMHGKPGEVTEPEWVAAASIASKCEDGEERFHRLSKLDQSRYSEGETAAKFRHSKTLRPRTCGSIENDLGFEGCKRCPFKAAAFRSPYSLAFGDPALLELQSRYVLVADTELYTPIRPNDPSMSRNSFNDHFGHTMKAPHRAFVADKRSPKVCRTDYLPGNDHLVVDDNGTSVLNVWTKGGVEATAGDFTVIMQHFEYLLPNVKERDWVLDYLAHTLQKPSVKIKHGLIFIGAQGIGKSFITILLDGFFGSQNVFVDDARIHSGKYLKPLGNRQFVVFEEMSVGGKYEVADALKPLITSEQVQAEAKFQNPVLVRTPRGIINFTNHALPTVFEQGERRNAVFRINAAPKDQTYYERLFGDGPRQAAAFKRLLLDRDITAWSPHAHPLLTEAKEDIIDASRTPTATAMQELVRSGAIGELTTLADVLRMLNPPSVIGAPIYDLSKVQKAAHELHWRSIRTPVRIDDGRQVRLWVTQNANRWLNATSAELRACYSGRRTATGRSIGLVETTPTAV